MNPQYAIYGIAWGKLLSGEYFISTLTLFLDDDNKKIEYLSFFVVEKSLEMNTKN